MLLRCRGRVLALVVIVTLSAGFVPTGIAHAGGSGAGLSQSPRDGALEETPSGILDEGECEQEELDDRCEKWTAGGAAGSEMVVSPTGDRYFTWGGTTMVAQDAATGEKRWEANLAGLRDLTVSSDGTRVYAVGDDVVVDAVHPEDRDVIVATYDAATGSQLWHTTLGLPPIDENDDRYYSRERGLAVAASPDGKRVYVTGNARLYDRLDVTPDCGPCPVTNPDVLIAGFDAATGARQWVGTWGERFAVGRGTLIAVSPDSRDVYVGGTYGGCGRCLPDFLTLGVRAYRPAAPAQEGTDVWSALYDGFGGGEDEPVSLELAPDGSRVYLTGYSAGVAQTQFRPDYDWATVAYRTSTGAQAWASRYQGPPDDRPDQLNRHFPDGNHRPSQLAVDPGGEKVFVTGTFQAHALADTRDATGYETICNAAIGCYRLGLEPSSYAATLAYDAVTGEQVWAAYFPTHLKTAERQLLGPSLEYPGKAYPYQIDPPTKASSLDVSPDGQRVYVLGTTSDGRLIPNSPDRGQTTVSYDAGAGTPQWIARIPGRQGAQVSAHPDGTLVYTLSTNDSIQAYEAKP